MLATPTPLLDLAARVDAWVTSVESAHRAPLVGSLASLDEVSKDFLPIDLGGQTVKNLTTSITWDSSPVASLRSFLSSLFNCFL